LEKTGIVLVPGSGFKQYPGTFHYRITTLILPEEKLKKKLDDLKAFNDEFMATYS
jgi:alanine transaminase